MNSLNNLFVDFLCFVLFRALIPFYPERRQFTPLLCVIVLSHCIYFVYFDSFLGDHGISAPDDQNGERPVK